VVVVSEFVAVSAYTQIYTSHTHYDMTQTLKKRAGLQGVQETHVVGCCYDHVLPLLLLLRVVRYGPKVSII
jgi:hypothetical protein